VDTKHAAKVSKDIEGITGELLLLAGGSVDTANDAFIPYLEQLKIRGEISVANAEAQLAPYLQALALKGMYHLERAYAQASPGLVAILAAIWGALKTLWNVISTIIGIVQTLQELHVFDLLAAIWPKFEEVRAKFRRLVSDLSKQLGWGVDGLLHLLHATQGFTDVFAGLTGKSIEWMDIEWMVKTESLLTEIETRTHLIDDYPGYVLEVLFQGEGYKNREFIIPFGEDLAARIQSGIDKGVDALDGLGSVSSELLAIRDDMPEAVRKFIPVEIWTGLANFEWAIYENIMPVLKTVQTQVKAINDLIESHNQRISELADNLKHPGTGLLTIDDLPDYAKNLELLAVDDVTSRLFADQAAADREALSSDIEGLELIDAAIAAGIPEVEGLTLEDPKRAAVTGIVAEPLETWFIDGFNDQH